MPTGKWCYGNRYFYSAKQKMVTWQGLAVEIQQITFEKPAAKWHIKINQIIHDTLSPTFGSA